MAEFRLSPKAQADLEGIFDHGVVLWGFDQALRYTDLIESACADLASAPQRSQDCSDVRPGYRRKTVQQHAIYFRETDYGIAVVRILHVRMDKSRHL